MDATHFVHHPRTAAIQAAGAEKIDSPRSLNTKFYFPFSDRTNIRYDVKLEPRLKQYADLIMAMPEMQEWIEAARAEPSDIEELEVDY